MQASQSAPRCISKSVERRDTLAPDEALGALVRTAPNHPGSLVRNTYNVKARVVVAAEPLHSRPLPDGARIPVSRELLLDSGR